MKGSRRTGCLGLVYGIEIIVLTNAPSVHVWNLLRNIAVFFVPMVSHLELKIEEIFGSVLSPVYQDIGSRSPLFGGVVTVVLLDGNS